MSKKFLQSLTILGLLSTALGVAQPVGAVVSGKYHHTNNSVVKEIKERLDEKGKTGYKISSTYSESKQYLLNELFALAFYLIGKEEFREEEYQSSIEQLKATVFGYDEYLKLLKVETTDINKKSLEQLEQLTINQYNEIESGIKNALLVFASNIIDIQSQKSSLVTIPLYINTVKKYFYEDGYYDVFFGEYMAKLGVDKLIKQELQTAYFAVVNNIVKIKNTIKGILLKNNFDNKDELQFEFEVITKQNKKKSNITSEFERHTDIVKGTVLAEDIPNIRRAEQTLKELEDFLTECLNLEKKQSEESQPVSEEKRARSSAIGTDVSLNSNSVEPVTATYKSQEASVEQDTVVSELEIPSQQSQASTTTAAQVIEVPQAISEPQEEVTVQTSLDDYTKSQINFWIEDFNTSLNKINYSGIYSEYLESLITRGKQLRNKLDKALGENKSSDDIKRDLDQLEMISNTITSVGNARNS
ncbi:coagulase domain-containing protein [Streptococcus halichoeri]|uniref:coagulase domain-containing protein n=1 Tax=Streptococcus halichoeri TaxID=254785 RepID=UPI001359B81F|nr:coagulase domain-containing protein [Streptococcus halichoeri]